MRDELTNELYIPLTSTVALKSKQETLFAPLEFKNNLKNDALPDSRPSGSATAKNELDTIKQQASNNILIIDDTPNFHLQVASGQLEKPLATITLKFENGDNIFAEHFIVMKKLTPPIIGLHFMRTEKVVIDRTHDLIHFPHLTMQVKAASNEPNSKSQPVLTNDALTKPPRTTKNNHSFC